MNCFSRQISKRNTQHTTACNNTNCTIDTISPPIEASPDNTIPPQDPQAGTYELPKFSPHSLPNTSPIDKEGDDDEENPHMTKETSTHPLYDNAPQDIFSISYTSTQFTPLADTDSDSAPTKQSDNNPVLPPSGMAPQIHIPSNIYPCVHVMRRFTDGYDGEFKNGEFESGTIEDNCDDVFKNEICSQWI